MPAPTNAKRRTTTCHPNMFLTRWYWRFRWHTNYFDDQDEPRSDFFTFIHIYPACKIKNKQTCWTVKTGFEIGFNRKYNWLIGVSSFGERLNTSIPWVSKKMEFIPFFNLCLQKSDELQAWRWQWLIPRLIFPELTLLSGAEGRVSPIHLRNLLGDCH